MIRRWFNDPSLPSPDIAEYVSGHEPMIMLVAAGYGIGIGLESQISLYSHPDVIIRSAANEIPDTATYIVTMENNNSVELKRFIDRALIVGGMMEHTHITSPPP
ncbi:hypothetical protein [Pseudomonas aeruginosa]|uniref:hypothetical protein n=1 Tax=Pseudomonas aeruginosa TaxID=287 RepID=UPI001E5121FA|nr:hypothetical protein [Pseudomonas aeruginosa]